MDGGQQKGRELRPGSSGAVEALVMAMRWMGRDREKGWESSSRLPVAAAPPLRRAGGAWNARRGWRIGDARRCTCCALHKREVARVLRVFWRRRGRILRDWDGDDG